MVLLVLVETPFMITTIDSHVACTNQLVIKH